MLRLAARLRREMERKGALSALATLVLGAGATVTGAALVINFMILQRTRPYIVFTVADVPPATVALVPGARVYPNGVPAPALRDRLDAAADLYAAGRVKKVLASGDPAAPEYDEVHAMGVYLRDRGVPAEDLFLDHAGVRTFDTMARAARVFGVRDAVICTQAFHLPRSVFLARAAGIDAHGLVADRRLYPSRRYDDVRELIARTVAFLDVYVWRKEPRHLGPKIPIEGSGRTTHGAGTPAVTRLDQR